MLRPLVSLALAGLFCVPPSNASSFGRFQHGGRGTAQAGALVARADGASAVAYNPAALTRFDGLSIQAGLDFDSPTVESSSASGSDSAEHSIQFPPALYVGWHPAGSPFALGLGLHSPLWRLTDWQTGDSPGRFTARGSEARLFELRAVGAWRIDPRSSIGGGARLVRGELGYSDARTASLPSTGGPVDFEVDRLAEVGDADGAGFLVAFDHRRERWGFGATWASAVEIEGNGELTYVVRDPAALPADALAAARARFRRGTSRLSDSLPERWTAGLWLAASARLRLELDAELARWSAVATPRASDEPDLLGPPFAIGRRSGWRDTLSLRAGAELALDEAWSLGAGLAFEPSPADSGSVEPGAPQGDALVLAGGASWAAEKISFDLGASYHDHAGQDAERQEADPAIRSRYSARVLVWAVSARWSF